MGLINEIEIGADERYNGLIMFRKYNGEQGFAPYFKFLNDDELSMESNIVVHYIEYYKNNNGNVIKELTKYKNYVIPCVPAVKDETGAIITPEFSPAKRWFLAMARTPIQTTLGIMSGIEATLSQLPMDLPNGYHLKPQ